MILATSFNTKSSIDSWTPGVLGNNQFKAPLVSGVGILAVANNRTCFLEGPNPPNLTVTGTLSLFVGGIDGLVHEYMYYVQNNTWTAGSTFIGTSGYSGIGSIGNTYFFELGTFNDNGVL